MTELEISRCPCCMAPAETASCEEKDKVFCTRCGLKITGPVGSMADLVRRWNQRAELDWLSGDWQEHQARLQRDLDAMTRYAEALEKKDKIYGSLVTTYGEFREIKMDLDSPDRQDIVDKYHSDHRKILDATAAVEAAKKEAGR